MEFRIKTGEIAQLKTPCILIGIFEGRKLAGPSATLDLATGGRLSELLKKGDMDGRLGGTLMLYDLPGLASERVLVVGCGKHKEFGRDNYRKALVGAVAALQQTHAGAALCTLPELGPDGLDLYAAVRDLVTTAEDKTYRYTRTKKDDKLAPKTPLKRLEVWLSDKSDQPTAEQAIKHGTAIAAGMALSKELGNLPGNICTPTYLAEKALELGERYDRLETEILEEADMEELKMGASSRSRAGVASRPS